MVRLALLLFVLAMVLAVVAMISCLSAEPGTVRGLPRWAWIIVILLLPLAGPTLYLLGGRPEGSGGLGSKIWQQATRSTSPAAPRRTPAPDDDPDFLSKLDLKSPSRDEDLFRRWEADLHRDGETPSDPRTNRRSDGSPTDAKPRDAKPRDAKPRDAKPRDGKPRSDENRKPEGRGQGRGDEAREPEVRRHEDTPPAEG